MKHAFLAAGTQSSEGKTTFTLSVLSCLAERGFGVQPFKAGPDYIDPAFHDLFSPGRRSRNLDTWLLRPEDAVRSFHSCARDADVAVVEGVMGLYDGRRDAHASASSAELAKLLGIPVVLVVDSHGMAQSAGAVALGFASYDPGVKIAGVVFNRCQGPGHYAYLKEGLESRTGLKALGFLPPDDRLAIRERHLGLTTAAEFTVRPEFRRALLEAGRTIDFDALLAATAFEGVACPPLQRIPNVGPACVAVAYDKAFSFYYYDNLELLERAGARLELFSPLRDREVPAGAGAVYFGGGFPELYASELAHNGPMLESLAAFHAAHRPIYAECGGLMYLAETLIDAEGRSHQLAGLLPGTVRMTAELQSFGYHELESCADTFLFSKGERLRCHEFHTSSWDRDGQDSPAYLCEGEPRGYAARGLLASYQHLHFGSRPDLACRLVQAAAQEVLAWS